MMQFPPSPPSTIFQRPFPSFIQFIAIAVYVADGINADHVWEDFPGAEMKGLKLLLTIISLRYSIMVMTLYIFREISLFLSDILSDIEKKKFEVEKSESQAYKGEEETKYDLLPLVPKSEAQKQYLPTFSENEYEVTVMNLHSKSSLISQKYRYNFIILK